eukprot:maker-scaffold_91-snap-gene-0.40-mRNA-1 protein AED:0.43 eAED:0.44 QI:0/0/0/1/1/1/2/0/101
MGKKSKNTSNFNAKLKLVMKTGYKQAIKALRSGKAKTVIVANNCPSLKRSEIEYYGFLGKTDILFFSGGNNELGTAAGKYFRVSCIAVTDPGDSDILEKEE